jgi:low density lipoprotein receptor-related protein 5/6
MTTRHRPKHSSRSGKTQGTAAMSLSGGSGGPPHYDINHVTGASSSSSTVTQYPKETLNPPRRVRSPTVRYVRASSLIGGDRGGGYLSNSPSTVRSYRPYKLKRNIPPPPTTPCSTDVCEDSEPYPNPNKYYINQRTVCELNYYFDPYPPTPTPRSHYFSDDRSCPPSPSTERSYVNPYPPPPSSVGNSDC